MNIQDKRVNTVSPQSDIDISSQPSNKETYLEVNL